MNTPIRRLSVVVLVLFTALMVATTWIQFGQAAQLRDRPENRRTLMDTYARERGAILVDGKPVARSERTDDDLRWIRQYDSPTRYAHLTGYYSFTYGAGGGLEQVENGVLAGTDDSLFYRRLVDLVTGTPSTGASLELTIDPAVQQAADQALGDRRGAVVALDPRTGALLALVSHPSYDPNLLASHRLTAVDQAWQKLSTDPARPMLDRAIAGDLYPPGSTFKLITSAAALESGRFTPESQLEGPVRYTLPGTTTQLPNFGGAACDPQGRPTLARSLQISCNTAFAWLAGQLGEQAMAEQAKKFGFGGQVQIPMRVTPSQYPSGMNPSQLAMSGIGQYDVRVTPLQVAMVSAAIANGGVVMEPYTIDTVRSRDLEVIQKTHPKALSRAVSGETARALTSMMEGVVQGGSGVAAQIPGMAVAGKTGTAEFGTGGAAHAWFTGFAPADDPKVAVAVVVEAASDHWTGETGGTVAAPIARAVLEAGAGR